MNLIKTQRVPDSLLLPIEHPVAEGPPYTVEQLLIVLGQYDNKLEEANDRFAEIKFIQSDKQVETE